jgi:A/G-specific adenine glycosylase
MFNIAPRALDCFIVIDPMQLPKHAIPFRAELLRWYKETHRPLPWRSKPNIYRTVVSEFMLQQTQVKTMLPYYERWMQRFPDFQTLASAPAEDVLKHWEGLGYYSRARNLHKLAQNIQALKKKPATPEEWQALPGIGPYTAAAIASIAQNHPTAVVDGNVVRVLARLNNDTRTFKSNAQAVTSFEACAQELVNPDHPGDHNQAMMELGATLCLKKSPACDRCPVHTFCQAAPISSDHAASIPRIERPPTRKVEIERALIIRNQAILLHRIPDHATRLAGQFEIPAIKDLSLPHPRKKPHAVKSRGIANERIKESLHLLNFPIRKKIPTHHQWVKTAELNQITLVGPHRSWLQEILPSL